MAYYTDGSCLGNPGPGGWAVVWAGGELSGSEGVTTNNRMELRAAIEAVRVGASEVVTDSTYVQRGATEWSPAWVRRGFRGVRNADLWRELLGLLETREVRWSWVRGHSGSELNERADRVARARASERADEVPGGDALERRAGPEADLGVVERPEPECAQEGLAVDEAVLGDLVVGGHGLG